MRVKGNRQYHGPPPMFSDEEFRERFLSYIEAGDSIGTACKKMPCSVRTYQNWCERDPAFRAEVDAARESSADGIFRALREQAEGGDVGSAALYLKHKLPPQASPAQEVTVRHQLTADPEAIRTIKELHALVERRAALPAGDVIDVEELHDSAPDDIPPLR